MTVAAAPTTIPATEGYEPPAVEIVVPVLDEASTLARSIRRLDAYLRESFPFSARITIADNGSTDGTWELATALASELRVVRAVRLEERGRGRALNAVWSGSDARVLAYMDVDLSTDLAALLPLVAPLLSGHSDLAIGSRLARGANVVRGAKRELISRSYNAILHVVLGARFSDAQCGFKAIRADRARELLPLVRDRAWFFDTELLVLAERAGLRIHEVPVDWTDDPDSRVDIVSTAAEDLRGVWRMLLHRRAGTVRRARSHDATADQLLRFAGVGVISTLGYLFLFVAWRPLLGPFAANAVAMAIATLFNTAVHRELSRHADGAPRRTHRFLVASGLYAISMVCTTAALAVAQWLAPGVLAAQLVALTAANLVASVFRFALLRAWIFPSARRGAEHLEMSS